jgi:phage tail-like protein
MECLQAPSEAVLESLDTYFDPRQAPEDWLPSLARWLDLDRLLTPNGEFPGGPKRLRMLILSAVALNQERGTQSGLEHFLQTATGIEDIAVETAAAPPYHIKVSCPAPDQAYGLTYAQFCAWLERLVAAEKPAYVTYEVEVKPQTGKPPA